MIEKIIRKVSKYFRLQAEDLKSTTRTKAIAIPRQIAIYLIRKRTKVGFKEIGKCFGGKDHTTILYAFRKVSAELDENNLIKESVEAIGKLLDMENQLSH